MRMGQWARYLRGKDATASCGWGMPQQDVMEEGAFRASLDPNIQLVNNWHGDKGGKSIQLYGEGAVGHQSN